MLTKDISQELEAILSQLMAQGKEPTVALVKARLSQPVPMPAIISVMKSWKSSKHVPKVEIADSSKTASAEQRIEELEQKVAQLMDRVSQLETQLSEK